jgi:hypothetical protein
MVIKKNTHGLDKKTYTLIKKLLVIKKETPKKFTNIDERFLNKLITREIDYE